eukprot:CAMPEP_0170144414 /NCGR_PEP_ID=MMETSP0033_2-20121228/13468_1 /TAXON_ID=195969 /ORGANISM="Dolichomastix tenuilepis, Strain CCMP3274" /LENGTH=203 /DNA_ID=CAMNT_0010380911 /DNA_START=53 /DNA_END=660 /DNA_ORIENTATION=+
MARNQEKAMSMLNRFLSGKAESMGVSKKGQKRPYLATECRDLDECDKWRQQILREIGKKVMEIQNTALGEHRVRDLNDEINKLMREKVHWERQILKLGGPNYMRAAKAEEEEAGSSLPAGAGSGRGPGYRYFGAAKNLPGVKELFEKPQVRTVRKSRHQMNQGVDLDYFGFRDEEDGVLLRAEAAAEAALREQLTAEWDAAAA